MIIGRNVGVMYGTESTFGTAVAATTPIDGRVSNFSARMSNNFLSLRGLGDGRNVKDFIYGAFDVSGSITFDVGNFDFLKYAIGPRSGSGTAGAPYLLTEANEYGTGASDINSFTMVVNKEDGSSDVEDTYTGCIITDFTLSGAEVGVMTCTANFVAQKVSSDTSIANAYTSSTVTPWVNIQSVVSWGATPTAIAKCTNWSVSYQNNAIIYRSIGSRFIEQPVAGERGYGFSFVVRDQQSVLTTFTKELLGDASEPYTPNDGSAGVTPTASLEFKLVFTGAGDRSATINLDESVLNDNDTPVSRGNDIVQVTFNGFAKEGKGNVPLQWVN